ncbi:unnamed protein product [Caenorhabditis sp. 36 PRJEB53466]|nr:unnamed protein product [Caenorhabditis sp. 36 PRJEB53466]
MVRDTSDENQPSSAMPDDLALLDQQAKCIEDEQKSVALVGEKVPMAELVNFYNAETSPTFLQKASELAEVYSEIRRIRGDGNCFYRAVLVGVIEILLKDRERLARFLESSRDWIQRLVRLGFPDWTCTDFCDYFVEFLNDILTEKLDECSIFEKLNDDNSANYLLMFFRLITSGYLKEHTDEYEPFIANGQSMAQYCEGEIEAMWREADHLSIIGLVKALDLLVRIEYMDRNAAPNGGFRYDIPSDTPIVPEITLLYRPGHYDLIYAKPAHK